MSLLFSFLALQWPRYTLLLVFLLVLCPKFAPSTVPTFQRTLLVVLASSQLPMFIMLSIITSQKAENAAEVTRTLMDITNQPISSQTVRRHLKKAGMKAVVKRKRPLLKKRHRQARLDFALTHKDWTVEDWKRVVWSDETKINRLGSDGKKWVWKRPGEGLSDRLVEGTVKFGGGSLMMWGCMLWEGPGFACKMDGDLYIKIMQDELEESRLITTKGQRR
jgi:hypothetical protein